MVLNNKKGYTLVELVIAMGMFAVVSSAIMVFLVTGTTNYRRNKVNSEMQKNAQLAIMQLTSFTQESMYVEFDGTYLTFYTPKYFSADTVLTADQKYGKAGAMEKKVVAYSAEDDALYYGEFDDITADSTSILTGANKENRLMADYVEDFSVDTSNLDKNNTIKVTLDMERESQKFELSETIMLRNTAKDPEISPTPAPAGP